MPKLKCCLCGKPINGFGNNPYPLDKREGVRCCDKCNAKVILARLELSDKYTFKAYMSGGKKWAVYAPNGEMLCVCLYRKGAECITSHLNEVTKKENNNANNTTKGA